ncbi:MAG: hypothetical protein QOJ10_228 [Chloroflexota bacterium]|nr:hypothetical protein [Chloroflexota bacterium]
MTRLRSAVDSPGAVFALISMFVALVSLWTIKIARVPDDSSFGFQSLVCWLVVLAVLGALLLPNLKLEIASLLAAEVVLVAWYAWETWLATTTSYASQYNFVGTDLVGPAWYAAALGLLFAAAAVARRYRESDLHVGPETWWLAAVPGSGLRRLDRTTRGLMWASLVAAALWLASLDSPIAPLFQTVNGMQDLPDPLPTRAPTWILLGIAALSAVLSVVDTIRFRRRLLG